MSTKTEVSTVLTKYFGSIQTKSSGLLEVRSDDAGFLYPFCEEMRTMPELPGELTGTKVDIDEKGNVVSLF